MSDDFQSHELLTATKLNRALRSGRCIGRARRVTGSNASTSGTRIPVLELDDIPLVAGRQYEIKTNTYAVDGVTNNDVAVVDILYTTDGSTPAVATSSVLPGATCETQQVIATQFVFGIIETTYTPAADELLSLLLCIRHSAGVGAMNMPADGTARIIEMRVLDCGEDPGDTGVDL